ncbi:MAG TPA: type IV pilus biogenesis/stability protein PilW [Steroidobacteraceae bacterium]|nr:type IV pilus biogenesis/stability protein PilW [Steroidobacteraceae bacterium]
MTKSSGTILDGDSRPRRGKAQEGPSTKSSGTVGLIAAAALLAGILAGCASQQEVQQRKDAAVYNTELGIAYLRRGDLAIAQTKLDRALEENSDDPNVHSARALLFARMREEKQADREFREALRLAPKNPDYRNNYAVYLCSVGRTDEGVQSFLSAARNPLYMTPEIAYDNAGVCLRSAHRDVEAMQMFGDALQIRPNFSQALWQLADLNFSQGKLTEARRDIDTFLASNQATPDLLLLAVKVTRAQGDKLDSELFARRLQLDFPDSDQAHALADLGHNPG